VHCPECLVRDLNDLLNYEQQGFTYGLLRSRDPYVMSLVRDLDVALRSEQQGLLKDFTAGILKYKYLDIAQLQPR